MLDVKTKEWSPINDKASERERERERESRLNFISYFIETYIITLKQEVDQEAFIW